MLRSRAIKIFLGITVLAFVGISSIVGQNRTVVLVQPPPLEANAGEDQEIFSGDTVQLGGIQSAKNGYGDYLYIWTPNVGLDNPTSPNPNANPETSINYILSVYDGKNCLAQDDVYISVSPNSIQSLTTVDIPIIYPNPSTGLIRINLTGYSEYKFINVLSTLGEVLQRINLESYPFPEPKIDLSPFGKGIYFIGLQSETHHVVQKVWIF